MSATLACTDADIGITGVEDSTHVLCISVSYQSIVLVPEVIQGCHRERNARAVF